MLYLQLVEIFMKKKINFSKIVSGSLSLIEVNMIIGDDFYSILEKKCTVMHCHKLKG